MSSDTPIRPQWGSVYDASLFDSENPEVLRAFNTRDADLLRKALQKSPKARHIQLWWSTAQRDRHGSSYSLPRALLKMEWAGAIAPLWEAGERFENVQGTHSLLTLATKHVNAPIVRRLLKLGMNPNGDTEHRPLFELSLRAVDQKRQKNNRQWAIWRAYAKAGVNPWATDRLTSTLLKRKPTAIEHLLLTGQVYAAEFFLAYALEAGKKVPDALLADGGVGFSKALTGAIGRHTPSDWPVLELGVSQQAMVMAWGENKEGLASIMRSCAGLGIPAPVDLRDDLLLHLGHFAAGLQKGVRELSVACDVGKMLVEAWPELDAGNGLTQAICELGARVPSDKLSFWQARLLDASVAPVADRPRVRL